MIEIKSNDEGKHWVRLVDKGNIISVTTDLRDSKEEALADLARMTDLLLAELTETKGTLELRYYASERIKFGAKMVRGKSLKWKKPQP